MALNKNISVWRGDKTPPTDYHLWVKESGSIWIKLPGEDNWQCVGSSTTEDLANKIIKLEEAYQKQQEVLDEVNGQLEIINHGQIQMSSPEGSNYNIYSIVGGDGQNVFGGSEIQVPKLFQVKIGNEDAFVKDGQIVLGEKKEMDYLLQLIYNNGSYELTKTKIPTNNISAGDGLQLSDGVMSIKIDQTSSDHLSVSKDGLKLDDIPVDNISIEDIQNYF